MLGRPLLAFKYHPKVTPLQYERIKIVDDNVTLGTIGDLENLAGAVGSPSDPELLRRAIALGYMARIEPND